MFKPVQTYATMKETKEMIQILQEMNESEREVSEPINYKRLYAEVKGNDNYIDSLSTFS